MANKVEGNLNTFPQPKGKHIDFFLYFSIVLIRNNIYMVSYLSLAPLINIPHVIVTLGDH